MNILLSYVDAAMRQAKYEVDSEDGTYSGEIPGFRGAFARATSSAACEQELRRILEEWVLFRVYKNLPLPTIEGIRLSQVELQSEMLLLDRLHQLERDIDSIRLHVEKPIKHTLFASAFKNINNFFNSSWSLLSFLSAICLVTYVYFTFGVDYFEEYRRISATKNSAEFHRNLGDQMLGRAQFKSAEEAYENALKINPNNLAATQGILRAQVLKPAGGQKYYIPEVVEAKLKHLRSIVGYDDYLIHYYEGVLNADQNEFDKAKACFINSIKANPRFLASHIMLGFTRLQAKDDVTEAIGDFKKALDLDPAYAKTHLNLGSCYMLLEDFDKAIEHLTKSTQLLPQSEAALMLGDAQLYKSRGKDGVNEALRHHLYALHILEDPNVKEVDYVNTISVYNYMPSKSGDRDLIKNYIYTDNLMQRKALVHYALSFDRALMRKFNEADKEFDLAFKLEDDEAYKRFFSWKITSLMNFVEMDNEVKSWFQKKLNTKLKG